MIPSRFSGSANLTSASFGRRWQYMQAVGFSDPADFRQPLDGTAMDP